MDASSPTGRLWYGSTAGRTDLLTGMTSWEPKLLLLKNELQTGQNSVYYWRLWHSWYTRRSVSSEGRVTAKPHSRKSSTFVFSVCIHDYNNVLYPVVINLFALKIIWVIKTGHQVFCHGLNEPIRRAWHR